MGPDALSTYDGAWRKRRCGALSCAWRNQYSMMADYGTCSSSLSWALCSLRLDQFPACHIHRGSCTCLVWTKDFDCPSVTEVGLGSWVLDLVCREVSIGLARIRCPAVVRWCIEVQGKVFLFADVAWCSANRCLLTEELFLAGKVSRCGSICITRDVKIKFNIENTLY